MLSVLIFITSCRFQCDYCYGEGEIDCFECDGEGSLTCDVCDGEGRLICSECDGTSEEECIFVGGKEKRMYLLSW